LPDLCERATGCYKSQPRRHRRRVAAMTASFPRLIAACLAAACLAGCVTTRNSTPNEAAKEARQGKLDKEKNARMLNDARALLDAGHPAEAISKDLDPVIAAFESAYAGTKARLYSPRSLAETLLYLSSPEARAPRTDIPAGTPTAIAVDPVWSTALYLKGYASIELKQFRQAHEALERAVAMAPMNAQYLTELGQLYLLEKNWAQASVYFERAVGATQISPSELKDKELARAWRGIAYVDIENGQLDAAIALFEKCLALNPADQVAANELQFAQARKQAAPK
jgi:tetratricopeptide (TPR) repeat protein